MDWKRSARRDLLVGGAVVVAMVGLVVLGTGSRAGQPTATTAPAPAPVAAVAAGTAGSVAVAGGSAAVPSPTAARHRPVVTPEVAGWVLDAAARPEVDVTVDFVGADGTVRSASTTADGAFAIVLPDGSYRVVCGVAGATCVTDSGTDTVLVSGPTALDLEVQSSPRG
jgi:hypothetical protein